MVFSLEIKTQLYNLCLDYVNQRIQTIQEAMDAAQSAANNESKSSAGDKYETTRSMMQIDKALNTKQLLEAQKLKSDLLAIQVNKVYESVQAGSLVKTNQGNFFVAISAGKIIVENQEFLAISLSSPIGLKIKHLRVNDEIVFNGKNFQIRELI